MPNDLLKLQIWQYNAVCAGYKARNVDELANKIHAAYYGAYWNGAQKHKKSLQSVIRSLYKDLVKDKTKKIVPIDVNKVSKDFEKLEDFRRYGWFKE